MRRPREGGGDGLDPRVPLGVRHGGGAEATPRLCVISVICGNLPAAPPGATSPAGGEKKPNSEGTRSRSASLTPRWRIQQTHNGKSSLPDAALLRAVQRRLAQGPDVPPQETEGRPLQTTRPRRNFRGA